MRTFLDALSYFLGTLALGLAGLAIYAADATHSYGWTPGLAVACVGGFIGSVVCVLAAILAREESGL